MTEHHQDGLDKYDNWPVDVRGQAVTLTERMAVVLGHELVGVYLHGSLAMGSFNPRRSDLDLLVVTRKTLQVAERRNLMELMVEVSRQPAPIELSVMTLDHLRPWRHPAPYDFHFSESWRSRFVETSRADFGQPDDGESHYDPDLAAHVTVTRSRGLCLLGEPIQAVFPEVPAGHMHASLAVDLAESLQAIDRNPVYTVLNCCRSLAYLKEGVVLSKSEGGLWALAEAPGAMAPIIRRALEAYCDGDGNGDNFAEPELKAFAAFARAGLKPILE